MVRRRFRPAWTTVRYEVYILQDDKKWKQQSVFAFVYKLTVFIWLFLADRT